MTEKDYEDIPDAKSRKRSSEVQGANDIRGHDSKRTRNDSMITLADVKIEPPIENLIDSTITHYEETFDFHQDAATTTSHQLPFWPMTYDHTGGLTALTLPPQDKPVEYAAFSAWSNDAFCDQTHNNYTVNSQYEEIPGAHRYDTNTPVRGMITNLDFMPLGESS